MRKMITIFLVLCFFSHAFGEDIIVTKQKRKYYGKVINRNENGFLLKQADGSVIVIPIENISKILQGKTVYDFEEKMKYILEVRRPFLPFIILGVAAGAYGVKRYQDYQDHHQKAQEALQEPGDDYTYLNDQSKKDLAWCVVSGLFSAGSFFIAFKPLEVRVPIGKLNFSTTSNGVTLALRF